MPAQNEGTMLTTLLKQYLFPQSGNADISALSAFTQARWRALYDESRQQGVTALLYDAILLLPPDLQPPRAELFRFASMAQTVEADNRRRAAALHHFADRLAADGIATVVVKGSSLARLYPKPLHRECGDNDLYTGSDTQRANAIAAALGAEVDDRNYRHSAFAFEGVEFECHRQLLYHDDDIAWQTVPFDPQADPKSTFRRLLPLHEALFVAHHIQYHSLFFHHSVLLNRLIDWSLLLSSPDFDYAAFCRLKQGTGADRFADLMTHYCIALFGLPAVPGLPPLDGTGLRPDDFRRLFIRSGEPHRLAPLRVAARSWHYLRFARQYRALYGRSPFRLFYGRNLRIALSQHI